MKKEKLIKLVKDNTKSLIDMDHNFKLEDQINSVKDHVIDKIEDLDLYDNQLKEIQEKEELSYYCVNQDYFKIYYSDGDKFIDNKFFAMVDLLDDLDHVESLDYMLQKDKHGIRQDFNSVKFSNIFCYVVGSHILEYK
tara:strand:+ start:1337 stop:1750 length:414 start_codon:yes stop_codon:yes gene_type:complete